MEMRLATPVMLDEPRRTALLAGIAFGLLSLLACDIASASVLCVSTVNGLTSAFNSANNGAEGTTWEIRLRPGTYQLTDDLVFAPDGSHDNKQFYFSGGWDATCSNQAGNAAATIGRGVAPAGGFTTLIEFTGDNARYDIDRIRFENFGHFRVDDKFCSLFEICPDNDTICIQRS